MNRNTQREHVNLRAERAGGLLEGWSLTVQRVNGLPDGEALIGQDCYGWGYQTVVMLFEKVHENKSPAKAINNFELSVVTKDNVDEYAGKWDKWLGKGKSAEPAAKK